MPCDAIIVTTATTRYTYAVLPYPGAGPASCSLPTTTTTGRETVDPDVYEVLNAVPGNSSDIAPNRQSSR